MKRLSYLLLIVSFVALNACDIPDELIPDDVTQPVDMNELYDDMPDMASCYEGILKDTQKQKALNEVNAIRNLHNLPAVSYLSDGDVETAKSALISVANGELTHYPDETYACYTSEGAKGSETSNLYIGYYTDVSNIAQTKDTIIAFLIDNNVESLGHRRWVIDPFLKYISYGRVDGYPIVGDSDWNVTGATLQVVHDEQADISDLTVEYVAYPYENYPEKYIENDWYLSFSVLADKESYWDNKNVDYSSATITVTSGAGINLTVHSISSNTSGAGLQNIIQWKADGIMNSVQYTVTIDSVLVNGETKSYDYWFTIE